MMKKKAKKKIKQYIYKTLKANLESICSEDVEYRIHDKKLTKKHGHKECVLFYIGYLDLSGNVDFYKDNIRFRMEHYNSSSFTIKWEDFTKNYLDFYIDIVLKYEQLSNLKSALYANEIPKEYKRKYELNKVLN